jgi:tRNA(fMet)-specific endonuclease VapC
MMRLYMLDTNICAYIKRKRPQTILDRFRKVQRGQVVISPITLGELHLGVEKSNDPARRYALTQLAIAAYSLQLDVTLVTNNEREFARVQGLKVENWG